MKYYIDEPMKMSVLSEKDRTGMEDIQCILNLRLHELCLLSELATYSTAKALRISDLDDEEKENMKIALWFLIRRLDHLWEYVAEYIDEEGHTKEESDLEDLIKSEYELAAEEIDSALNNKIEGTGLDINSMEFKPGSSMFCQVGRKSVKDSIFEE